MAQAGDVLDSPISGGRVLFRRTEADTDGRFLEVDIFLRAGGMGPPEHIHLLQSERFRVMAGRLAAKINGQVHRLTLGQEAVVPPGAPHTWWNAGDDELHVRVTLEPAAHFAALISDYFDLVNAGKITASGPVDEVAVGAWLERYKHEYRLATPG